MSLCTSLLATEDEAVLINTVLWCRRKCAVFLFFSRGGIFWQAAPRAFTAASFFKLRASASWWDRWGVVARQKTKWETFSKRDTLMVHCVTAKCKRKTKKNANVFISTCAVVFMFCREGLVWSLTAMRAHTMPCVLSTHSVTVDPDVNSRHPGNRVVGKNVQRKASFLNNYGGKKES